jgi:hypothetical protein
MQRQDDLRGSPPHRLAQPGRLCPPPPPQAARACFDVVAVQHPAVPAGFRQLRRRGWLRSAVLPPWRCGPACRLTGRA